MNAIDELVHGGLYDDESMEVLASAWMTRFDEVIEAFASDQRQTWWVNGSLGEWMSVDGFMEVLASELVNVLMG